MKLAPLLFPVAALGLFGLSAIGFSATPTAQPAPKPLKVLLVAGGCCHDYDTQTQLISAGLSKRANVEVEIVHNADRTTKPHFELYDREDWYKGYDVVIHDECAADVKDKAYLSRILKAHQEGTPSVAIHCAMHSYRVGDFKTELAPQQEGAEWFEFLGLQSSGHTPQEPIDVEFVIKDHPITIGLEPWTTVKEELYNNIGDSKRFPNHQALAIGKQTYTDKKTGEKVNAEAVVAWTNHYGPKKAPVFATTIGHNTNAYEDEKFMDLIARGLLWTAGKLDKDGKPLAGYEAP